MSHKFWGSLVLLAGLCVAASGYRILRSQGSQPRDFHGDPVTDITGFKRFAGMALMIAGLMLAMIFAPFFFIG
jgi:hypothetical protein